MKLFLDGLPKSLRDLVKKELQNQYSGDIIPYKDITYGQLSSLIQQVALKICWQDKILRKLVKDRELTHRDLGTFCEQFDLPLCKLKTHRRHSPKKEPLTSKSHVSRKIKCSSLKYENIVTVEDAVDEHKNTFNQIENGDLESSESKKENGEPEINVLSKEQNFLLEIIIGLQVPDKKRNYLDQFKRVLDKPSRSSFHILSHPPVTHTYNIIDILNIFPSKKSKPITIPDLRLEINILKEEIKEIKARQQLDLIVL